MLVGEDLLVPSAQITHPPLMNALDVPMQVWPAQACYIAFLIRTIVSQQEHGILEYLLISISYPKCFVSLEEVGRLEVLESLLRIVCEYDIL